MNMILVIIEALIERSNVDSHSGVAIIGGFP